MITPEQIQQHAKNVQEQEQAKARKHLFLKEGTTTFKIISESNSPLVDDWYNIFFETFLDKKVKKVGMNVLIKDGSEYQAVLLIAPISVYNAIRGMMVVHGIDFQSKDGYPVSVNKSGSGLQTKYSVLYAPKPFSGVVPTVDTPLAEQVSEYQKEKEKEKGKQKQANTGTKKEQDVTASFFTTNSGNDDEIPF